MGQLGNGSSAADAVLIPVLSGALFEPARSLSVASDFAFNFLF
jgi:hypothetical protein